MEKEHLELLLEDIRSKVEIVAEGYDLLNRKIDRVEANLSEKITANSVKIDHIEAGLAETRKELAETRQELNTKIDKVAVDLQAHRADTESHRGYRVAEG